MASREGERARAKAADDDDIVLFGGGTSIGDLGREDHASRFDPYSFRDPGSGSYSKQYVLAIVRYHQDDHGVHMPDVKNRSPIIHLFRRTLWSFAKAPPWSAMSRISI